MADSGEATQVIEPFVLAAGRRIGERYRLRHPLGRGGMAAVWLADDERLGRPVAIKVISDTIADDAEFLARFRREATVAAGLQHPNLVRVYDFDAGERPYLVMEYVEGGNLAEAIDSGEAPSPERLARELLSALRHIHAVGVLHRDVKPQNVLLDANGHARLTDFGIAQPRDATSLTATGKVIGTETYLAPEVLRGAPASERSDLYALGVVLADAARGGAGAPLWALIDRMRDGEPSRRPSSAAEALATLERTGAAGLGGEPTREFDEAPTAPLPPSKPPTPRAPSSARASYGAAGGHRARLLAFGALAVGVLALLVIGASALFGGDDDGGSGGKATAGEQAAKRDSNEGASASPDAAASEPAADAPAPAAAPQDDSASQASDGVALNDEGFALLGEGRYEEAIPVLEQAVAALEGSGDEATYNYALFNLAEALRYAGRPEEAIPYYEQRLGYDDGQLAEVEAALADARAAAGEPVDEAAAEAKPEKQPKPGKGPKKVPPGLADEFDDD